jgi:hypothetical protein
VSTIVPIVEGHGEVSALPVLLRRLGDWLLPGTAIQVSAPIRVRRDRFLRNEDEFRRMVLLAANKAGPAGWVLTLLDADDDCPLELASDVIQRARAIAPGLRLSTVVACREFEAWFIAAAPSIAQRRGISLEGVDIPAPEEPRNAKGWVERHLARGVYSEVTDQAKMAAVLDLASAERCSRSFRKLCKDFAVFAAE